MEQMDAMDRKDGQEGTQARMGSAGDGAAMDEELRDLLIAISVVAKALARQVEAGRSGTDAS